MRKFSLVAIVITMSMTVATPAYAADPEFIQGAKDLINDATNWLLGLIPLATALMVGYHALMRQLSDEDGMQNASRKRMMMKTLTGGAIGVSCTAIAKVILAYFQ